jgi:hypothetical protein
MTVRVRHRAPKHKGLKMEKEKKKIFVRIKTWEEMEKEFPMNHEGALRPGGYVFTKKMEQLLPEDRVIEVTVEGSATFYWYKKRMWGISEGMVAEYYGENLPTSQGILEIL